MKNFGLKIARWVLNHINEKDLIKGTDLDNAIIEQMIKLVDRELNKDKEVEETKE